jgi:hypothetical protein
MIYKKENLQMAEGNINIEDIMQEIKADIKEKGYTNDLLSFDDVVIDVSSMNATKFNRIQFNEDLYVANHEWEVNPYRPLQGNKVTVFFKKVIRKLVYFFVEPIVMAQDGFNASLVRMMNQMSCYIDEQNKEIEDLKKRIEKLENK